MNDNLKFELLSGDYLTGDHINFFFDIVIHNTNYRPQNAFFIGALEFVQPVNCSHIQILSGKPTNVNEITHWICSYYDGFVLHIYDSLNNQYISAEQIEFFNKLHPFKQAIVYEHVQKQPNLKDCGVFAIAFATSLIFGRDPRREIYIHSHMRKHLLQIFENMMLYVFPSLTNGSIPVFSQKQKDEDQLIQQKRKNEILDKQLIETNIKTKKSKIGNNLKQDEQIMISKINKLEKDKMKKRIRRAKETEATKAVRLQKDKERHRILRKKRNETSENIKGNEKLLMNKKCEDIEKGVLTENADISFKKLFVDNPFGHSCSICDRLWFQNDLKQIKFEHIPLLESEFSGENVKNFQICSNCWTCVNGNRIPTMSRSNGFQFPEFPINLPPLDPITERLISPRLPFMQIRRFRWHYGSHRILGQIINIPVDVDEMVMQLPRDLSDDLAFSVNIKKNLFYSSSYLSGFVQKSIIKKWLQFLLSTPLYKMYKVSINEKFFCQHNDITFDCPSMHEDNSIETIEGENESELFIGQQKTLLWNEAKYLEIAPGQDKQPLSIIYDTHAEELSFPGIYLGHPRIFKENLRVTNYMIANSEIRRKDRRAATPNHILYMAMKILRLRMTEGLRNNFKCLGNTKRITRQMIEDKGFLEECIEKNLSFLKSIPNSMQYWSKRKKDVFAMIRQLGKPTAFSTISANETRWLLLLQILCKLNGDKHIAEITELTALQRATMVNDDPVTCCIYFNKLINVLLQILSIKDIRKNPLGKYRVNHYFKRIEFQHRGSPHAHMLLWLDNDPKEAISEHMPLTIELITKLCSVSYEDLPNSYSNQVHKHTFTCYKKTDKKKCRFNIPYWPMDQTRILLPLAKSDGRYDRLKQKSNELQQFLENKVYETMEEFLDENNITFAYYLDIIRVSINRPTVIFKRKMNEIWTNTFNPWIANIVNSNTDMQFILDVYSCATYCTEYINKTNRGISNLHQNLINLQEENPEQDYVAMLKQLSIKILNSVEMCSQEAAWYLLRQPMSEASIEIIFIPTMWPHERIRSHKTKSQMDEEKLEKESTDVWTMNIIEKYEMRLTKDETLENVCLADFATQYTGMKSEKYRYRQRETRRILRYRNYGMQELMDYKREMVLLYFPFRNEHIDILDQNKFLKIFEEHHEELLRKQNEYIQDLDFINTMEEYQKISEQLKNEENEKSQSNITCEESSMTYLQPNMDDITYITPHITSIIKQKTDIMSKQEYCAIMRQTNLRQRHLILHAIYCIYIPTTERPPFQIFFTGPAGTGKTFTLLLLKETYNRFATVHTSKLNSFITCASTGRAALAIGGTTVHSAFRLAKSKQKNCQLNEEHLQNYRHYFTNVKIIIIDEISMISASLLHDIHTRLANIYNNYDDPFGRSDIIFCGDFRQLPPVNARAIYKPYKNSLAGTFLWQSLSYYPLHEIMRQSDITFSTILTKIGNGCALTPTETDIIQGRFRTIEWCKQNVPNAIRLYHKNTEVDAYNQSAFQSTTQNVAIDIFSGYKNDEQLSNSKTKLYDMSVSDTSGLPYIIRLLVGQPYMITTNVDVEDGIVNGAIGLLKHIEYDQDVLKRLWFQFENKNIGIKLKIKSRPLVISFPKMLNFDWVPIVARTANISITSQIKCKRLQFPLVPAMALTIHKSQGATFNEIVFNYHKSQEQQLVYVALTRVTSIDGLYLTNSKNDFQFYHTKTCTSPKMRELQSENERLEQHQQQTISDLITNFIDNLPNIKIILINTQSLQAHRDDIELDDIFQKADILALTETWLDDNIKITIKGFQCVSQAKRPTHKAAGVAIYRNTNPLNKHQITRQCHYNKQHIGDICITNIDQKITLITVYISPNTPLNNVQHFLIEHITPYITTPLVLCGDFNINILQPHNNTFLNFMKTTFQLKLISPKKPTTIGNSTIDMIFTKNITDVECRSYISYFTYHLPLVVILNYP